MLLCTVAVCSHDGDCEEELQAAQRVVHHAVLHVLGCVMQSAVADFGRR